MTFAYNTSKQESTHYTPFYLFYGRKALTPSDLTLSTRLNPEQQEPADYGTLVLNNLTRAREIVFQRLHRSHVKQNDDYDKDRKNSVFFPGDLVLIYKPIRKVGRSEKLLHRWMGPL